MAGDGQALLLEGFQVRLDLQLEPEGTVPLPGGSIGGRGPDAPATERATPRRAPVRTQAMPTYQQWAVLIALATLLLALASWWVGNEPAQPVTEHGGSTGNLPAQLPEPAASSAPINVPPAAPAVAAPAEPALVVPGSTAPPVAPALPAAARPGASSTPRPPLAVPGMRARTAKTSAGAPSAALAVERGGAMREAKPAARAPRLGSDDLLELFGDTK